MRAYKYVCTIILLYIERPEQVWDIKKMKEGIIKKRRYKKLTSIFKKTVKKIHKTNSFFFKRITKKNEL